MPYARNLPRSSSYGRNLANRGRDNPVKTAEQFGLMEAVAHGTARVEGIGARVAREMIEATPKTLRRKFARIMARRRNRNPSDAKEMSKTFHGRPVSEILDVSETESYDSELAVLGDLCELVIDTGKGEVLTIKFKKDKPLLCCDPQGKNLEVVGGDQTLEIETSKNRILLGEIIAVTYYTDKHHLQDSDGEEAMYEHSFAEDGGERPTASYDARNGKILIEGGDYTVEDVGIKG